MVVRHNHLCDVFVDFCGRARLNVSLENGHGLTRDHSHTRPADVLTAGCDRGKPAAFDVTVTSPLCTAILRESCEHLVQLLWQQRSASYSPAVPNVRNRGGRAFLELL